MRVSILFLAALLAGSLTAQNVAVFPSDHTNVPNGSLRIASWPYSLGISRVQMIYEAWDLGIPNGAQITRIGFRPDLGANQVGHALQLEVLMGGTDSTAANASNAFVNNYSLTPPAPVFGPGLYQLPNLAGVTEVWLDLTTPHIFDASRNLVVEWRILANSNGNSGFAYSLDGGDFLSQVTGGTGGCPHSGGPTPDVRMFPTKVGGNMRIDIRQGPANTLCALLLSVNSPLQPAYPLSAVVPGIATACQGQLVPLGMLTTTANTNASGARNVNITIPNNRLLWNNATVACQAALLDFFAPGGVVVSDAEMVEIGIDPASTLIYASNNASAATGSVARNLGLVTLFQYQ